MNPDGHPKLLHPLPVKLPWQDGQIMGFGAIRSPNLKKQAPSAKLGVWAAETFGTRRKIFDLSESPRSDYFRYAKG